MSVSISLGEIPVRIEKKGEKKKKKKQSAIYAIYNVIYYLNYTSNLPITVRMEHFF